MFSNKIFSFSGMFCCSVIVALLSPSAFAGGDSSGGGGPNTVSAGALKLLIEGGGLKRAMQNYLTTVQVDQIEDEPVKVSMIKMMEGNALIEDLLTPNNYFTATNEQPCVDAFNNQVPASTTIGKIGGRVCFDLDKLVEAYKEFSEEEVMIRLASLAIHEHTHHFQKPSADVKVIQQNEDEANRVAGYILVTAKFVQIPLLEWTPNDLGDQFEEIKKMYEAIRAKERAFLRPHDSDYTDYPNYKDQPDRGLFRILPREIYDGKLSMGGGGAYYSFSTKSNDYSSIAEIGLEQKEFSTGFAGCDFGYIVELGPTPLDQITTQMPALKYLFDFVPANDEPKIRRQQRQAGEGIHSNGYLYINRTKNISVGQTFALRSISFDYADILVAFRIVRAEKDGSLILAWKKLKNFPVSSCR